jgi:hypothetical protein
MRSTTMSNVQKSARVKVAVDDIEYVDGKSPYLKITAPSIIESVRALRRAAGLEGTGAAGSTSATK